MILSRGSRRLCCKLHNTRLRTHRRIKEIASWVPPRVAQAARGSTSCPSRAHQGQHREQWSGDAVPGAAPDATPDTPGRTPGHPWTPCTEGRVVFTHSA